MEKNLEQEFEYYIKNQADLVSKYNGKVLVIKDQQVFGAYDSEIAALESASKKYKLGTFLIQRCEPGSEGFTQTYHSRVSFV